MGPEIDVVPEMTAKIMTVNGELVHRSEYCGLKEDKRSNQTHKLLWKDFDSNIRDKFGPAISPDYFPGVNLEDTPLYEMYEEYSIDEEGILAGNTKDIEDPSMATELDREVPKPEVNYNYTNASVMLPRGNSYAIGKVIGRKIDSYENAVRRTNDNPIVDTREYCVEFDDGEVSELTENVISKSIYAECNDSGNEYLMM